MNETTEEMDMENITNKDNRQDVPAYLMLGDSDVACRHLQARSKNVWYGFHRDMSPQDCLKTRIFDHDSGFIVSLSVRTDSADPAVIDGFERTLKSVGVLQGRCCNPEEALEYLSFRAESGRNSPRAMSAADWIRNAVEGSLRELPKTPEGNLNADGILYFRVHGGTDMSSADHGKSLPDIELRKDGIYIGDSSGPMKTLPVDALPEIAGKLLGSREDREAFLRGIGNDPNRRQSSRQERNSRWDRGR